MTEQALTIKKAAYFAGMAKAEGYPGGGLPEVALAGKSNVGKSSLINYLANNSRLAYVSKQPGKTRLVNFFAVNDAFYLVDLPGYGYAKVSKAEKKSWADLMQGYFEQARRLAALFILTDIRHDPAAGDLQMVEWAAYYKIPFAVVATKADKIAKSKRVYSARKIKEYIVKNTMADGFSVLPVSALEKKGKDELLAYMGEMLGMGK